MLVTLQQPSRHTLHVKHDCIGTPRESATGRWEEERRRGREGDSEVSLNSRTACRWP